MACYLLQVSVIVSNFAANHRPKTIDNINTTKKLKLELIMKRIGLSLMMILTCVMAFAQEEVVDNLQVGKTLKFQGKKFELKWSQHPIEPYYIQEWLPKGETFDNYEQMLTVSLAFSEALTVRDAVEAKVQELEERKKSDKCCNYLVSERDGEYVLDFLVSDGTDGKLDCVEVDIHHYKPVTVNRKKAIQLNFYSRRAYGDDIIPFLESLKDKKEGWITELTQMKIVCKMK